MTIYSGTTQSVTVAGNLLIQNVVKTSDQQAEGWPGIFTDTAKQGTDPNAFVVTTLGPDVFALPDVFAPADVFVGLAGGSGYYEIDQADWVNVGYLANCPINVTWTATGAPEGDNILSIANVLEQSDILGAASSAYVDVYPQIAIATTETLGVPNWGSWLDYVPGTYTGQWFKFRWILTTLASNVLAYLLTAQYTVTVALRTDHYTGKSISSSGTVINFTPDGTVTASAFNGGPNGSVTPVISGFTGTTPGDTLVVTAISLSSATLYIYNGGSAVSRTGQAFTATGF